jgi:hypothetical protein
VAQVALSPNPEPGFSDEPSRFERLAFEVGVTEDELRGLLLRLIAKKVGWGDSEEGADMLLVRARV